MRDATRQDAACVRHTAAYLNIPVGQRRVFCMAFRTVLRRCHDSTAGATAYFENSKCVTMRDDAWEPSATVD